MKYILSVGYVDGHVDKYGFENIKQLINFEKSLIDRDENLIDYTKTEELKK